MLLHTAFSYKCELSQQLSIGNIQQNVDVPQETQLLNFRAFTAMTM